MQDFAAVFQQQRKPHCVEGLAKSKHTSAILSFFGECPYSNAAVASLVLSAAPRYDAEELLGIMPADLCARGADVVQELLKQHGGHCAADGDVKVAGFEFINRRIDNEFSTNATDADFRHRVLERNVRDEQRGRSRGGNKFWDKLIKFFFSGTKNFFFGNLI